MDESRAPIEVRSPASLADDATTACGRLCRATLFLGIGLFAGVVAFVGIAQYGAAFRLSPDVERLLVQEELTQAEAAFLNDALLRRHYLNTALSVAIFGGVAGGILGLAVGLRRKTLIASLGGLVGGMTLGTIFGGAGGLIELFAASRLWPLDFERTFKTMATHSTAFLCAGIGIGLGVGLAAKQVKHSLGVVLAAALIAGLAYPGLAAFLFPVADTDLAVPDTVGALLLWTVLPIALMGLALGRTTPASRPTLRT